MRAGQEVGSVEVQGRLAHQCGLKLVELICHGKVYADEVNYYFL